MMLLSVWRLTPRTSAPSVTDKPKGSRQSFLTMRPGCAGFFIGLSSSLDSPLVVVDQFNVKSIGAVEAKINSPIRSHRHRPKPLPFAFERMKAIPGNVESLGRRGGVEDRQDSFHRLDQVAADSSSVILLVKPFQATMLKAPDY